jgi:hypothetical protein
MIAFTLNVDARFYLHFLSHIDGPTALIIIQQHLSTRLRRLHSRCHYILLDGRETFP